jgi:mono/diheme cytochrome c family protein
MNKSLVVGLALLAAGCGGRAGPHGPAAPTTRPPSHPAGYPLRSDPLVLRPAPTLFGPGEAPVFRNLLLERLQADGGQALDPARLPANVREQLRAALDEAFGTPAEPRAGGAEDEALRQALRLDGPMLAAGGRLYKEHCLNCHGLTGNGWGPAAFSTGFPKPRDFRRGLFKYISSAPVLPGRKPRREDFLRLLREGAPGTGMLAYALLPAGDREALVSYTVYLSARGEVEFDALRALLQAGGAADALDGGVVGFVRERTHTVLEEWARSDGEAAPAPVPPAGGPTEESIRRGYRLFTDPAGPGACAGCHTDFGRKAPLRYDEWGTLVQPTDLTRGVYKGGGRPEDIYRRVREGIPGSGMPGAGRPGEDGACWDLVYFVLALPTPQRLPPDVRARVYPSGP